MAEKLKYMAVIRVRGVGDAAPQIEKTLENLHLNKNCHITLVDNSPSSIGMLKKARNFITWGEISKEALSLLLKKRGRLKGNRKLDEEFLHKIGFKTIEDFVVAIYNFEINLKQFQEVKPVFRAHPPKRGYKGTVKKSYTNKGVTGYRGEAINDLIRKMV